MANAENLEKAYAAIGSLLAKGVSKLSVGRVASESGLARQTFYQKDNDWTEVLEVIKGKPSSRVKLVQVEIERKTDTVNRLENLIKRVDAAEQEVHRLEDVASKVYRELIDEVQRWFDKAIESPKSRNQVSKYIEELNRTRDELERLVAENRLLKAERDAGKIKPFFMKKTIGLPYSPQQVEIIEAFLTQFEAAAPTAQAKEIIAEVYLLCGLPLSGKTFWIQQHQPNSSGLHLYIDGCNLQADLRRFLMKRLRSATKAPIHCVWVRTSADVCVSRIIAPRTGGATADLRDFISRLDKEFELPTLEEPFNSIVLA